MLNKLPYFFVREFPRIPPSVAMSRVLEARVPGAPSQRNPWNPGVPRAT